MFLGHFGVALASKPVAPRASLGTLFLAAQFLDLLWPVFLLSGIETVRIVPGITRVTPLDFVSYPYSHSLAAAVFWSLLVGGVYGAARRYVHELKNGTTATFLYRGGGRAGRAPSPSPF